MATPNQYNPNIPQSNDQLSQSQADLLNNFGAIQALIDINHIDFAAAGAGKHNVCEFPAPTTFTGTSGGEVALFAQTSSLTGNPVLCIQKQSNGLTTQFSESLNNPSGWCYLPSGILLKWGQSGNVTGTTTFSMPVSGPTIPVFSTTPFLVLFTLVSSNFPAAVPYWLPASTTTTTIGITMSNSFSGASTTGNVAWLAFGT